jgi:hypothetical protein
MAGQTSSTKFKPGQSGNPKGSPKAKFSSEMVKGIIDEALPDIIQVVIDAAIAGDMTAAKILVDKRIYSVKPVQEPYKIPVTTGTPATMGIEVLDNVFKGILGTDDASKLFGMLGTQHGITEVAALRAEIKELIKLNQERIDVDKSGNR